MKIPAGGELEIELLAAVLQRLCSDETLRERIGANARRYASEVHDLEQAAEAYAEFIAEAG